MINIKRYDLKINPDKSRVLLQDMAISPAVKKERVIRRILSLKEDEVKKEIDGIFSLFEDRHRNFRKYLIDRFERIVGMPVVPGELSIERKMLLGSYFTNEYSVEAAALFNPSMVWHPDQTGLEDGSRRFIVSLRAAGEGHISSLEFRSGIINDSCEIKLDPQQKYVTGPSFKKTGMIKKDMLTGILKDKKIQEKIEIESAGVSGDEISIDAIRNALSVIPEMKEKNGDHLNEIMNSIRYEAEGNYEIYFDPGTDISERIIFPSSPLESNGIEDARFVKFKNDDGSEKYYSTYTAYNGRSIRPMMIETEDFLRFKIFTIYGNESVNKGMALFPRKVNGSYAVISRQDNENLFLMHSDTINYWDSRSLLLEPKYPWEIMQIGNCGSPIETKECWLVLTHGVGGLRRYTIGAFLLDLDDPSKVIARMKTPLVEPTETEREGYVPNVVYSCGAIIHKGNLIIPYAVSDYSSGFLSVNLDDLFKSMTG